MNKQNSYSPPFTTSTKIVQLISEISEAIGHLSVRDSKNIVPQLRRSNRLRTIHASLAIENNTLSLEQVTAIINGKKVLGKPQEIQEVKNAFTVYEAIEQLNPFLQKDMLKAHKLLMDTLVAEAGKYRSGGVGIIKNKEIVHIAPPSQRIPELMNDLFSWVKNTEEHPLITSSVFHYEFEFIHPFSDGNGRMGRLWQTLILSKWRPILAYLPVETIIYNNQEEYYNALGKSDKAANSTLFIEFMLKSIVSALKEFDIIDPVSDPVTDPVRNLLIALEQGALSSGEIREQLNLKHRQSFRENYLHPALDQQFIERTIPDKPNSRLQKYRLTDSGRNLLPGLKGKGV